jgi:carbamoyl-phosphate synthase large subunit
MDCFAGQTQAPKVPVCLCTSVGIDGFAALHGALKAFYGDTITVIGCDIRPDAYGLYLADKGYLVPRLTAPGFAEQLLHIARQEQCDMIYPLSSLDQEYFAAHRAIFEDQGVRVIVSALEAVCTANDKARLYERCRQAGLPVAAYMALDDPSSLDGALRRLGYPARPVVFKPARGSGGRGLAIVREGASIFDSVHQRSDPPQMSPEELAHTLGRAEWGQGVLCEYLPGDEYSVDVLSWQGKALVSVVRKRYASLGGTAWHAEVVDDADMCRLGEAVVQELRLSYTSNVQFRRNADGVPCLMEVNPRTPGTIGLTVEAGVNMPALAVELALGRQIPQHFSIRYGMRIMRYFGGYYHCNGLLGL